MSDIPFDDWFSTLTGNTPFPWQRRLYEQFSSGCFPSSCNLPTGLGKTAVIPIWLLALATAPAGKVPRRLVYVVNRRTVVDQSTREAEKLRQRLPDIPEIFNALRDKCSSKSDELTWSPLAISTLRGQFADNREWSIDPARPAVVVGTVDMIGSRLLFSGYGVGFKAKPLHAGFLGQDVLLVHDEAHLEPSFQCLIESIQKEQVRCRELHRFQAMELSATSRGEEAFGITNDDRAVPEVRRRIQARKALTLVPIDASKKLPDHLAELALRHKDSGAAVLVFARSV